MAAAPREQLVDCRGDIKLPEFSGRDEDWPSWSIKARAFFALMGWDDLIGNAGRPRRTQPRSGQRAATRRRAADLGA
eukprot:1122104-Pyramimonas_sp.AAC.1